MFGDHSADKQQLINELRSMGINNESVLTAVANVPRENFVPTYLQESAYANQALPIDEQQTISQPYIVAKMTQELLKNQPKTILEIGTGSGYQAAILANCGLKVFSIERILQLYQQTKKRLATDYPTIQLKYGDGFEGWEEHAPYDAIIVTAASEEIPQTLINQLKVNGQMILPLKTSVYSQELVLLTKESEHRYATQWLDSVLFVPMKHGTR